MERVQRTAEDPPPPQGRGRRETGRSSTASTPRTSSASWTSSSTRSMPSSRRTRRSSSRRTSRRAASSLRRRPGRRVLIRDTRRDPADGLRRSRRASRRRAVLGHPHAGEQEPVERLAEQRGHLAVDERHPARARPQRVREQVEPALDQAGGELRLAVRAVVEIAPTSAAPITTNAASRGEPLVHARDVELVAHGAGAHGRREVGPAVDAGRDRRRRRAPRRSAGSRCRATRRPWTRAGGPPRARACDPCVSATRGKARPPRPGRLRAPTRRPNCRDPRPFRTRRDRPPAAPR